MRRFVLIFTLLTFLVGSGAAQTSVNLSAAYTLEGIVSDGTTFSSGGLDTSGYAHSANLLGISATFQGVGHNLGPCSAPDAVTSATVSLPAGQFSKLYMLATGLNGNETSQAFTVTYTDGTSSTFNRAGNCNPDVRTSLGPQGEKDEIEQGR